MYHIRLDLEQMEIVRDMSVLNDPLGRIHSPASGDHYSRLKVALFYENLKSGDGRKDERSDK